MRGHEPIVALRRRGLKPASVWFTVSASDVAWRDWPTWNDNAQVWVQPADSVPLLDLRFVVGLQCWVDGDDARRVLKMMTALDDHDDVQSVSANFNIPDDVMAELQL